MNKGVRVLFGLLFGIFLIGFASAACAPQVALVNQDPYPAIPGDYVKLVFQVNGIDNPDCGDVSISLAPSFPFSLDPGMQSTYSASSFFEKNYGSFMVVPYKVRIDDSALDGENLIEASISYGPSGAGTTLKDSFNVSVKDSRTDFEVFVKNYDSTTSKITFEILNIGKNNVKAVTIKVLDGTSINLKGPDVNIVGDLDSNEYTTADFQVSSASAIIPLQITYTDSIDVRRTLSKEVQFEPGNFDGVGAKKGTSIWMILFIALVVVVVGWFLWKRFKKKSHQ